MRVASRIAFGERNTGGRKLKKRYFLAFEGKVTERLYFEGLVVVFSHSRKPENGKPCKNEGIPFPSLLFPCHIGGVSVHRRPPRSQGQALHP